MAEVCDKCLGEGYVVRTGGGAGPRLVECSACNAQAPKRTENRDPLTDEEFEREARGEGWVPVKLGDPAPSPLLVLSWMRWALDCGYARGVQFAHTETAPEPEWEPCQFEDCKREDGHPGACGPRDDR